jgi:hypothetical protein
MKKRVFGVLGSTISACLAIGLSLNTAAAQDSASHGQPSVSPSGWGSGPMMASLLGSARLEPPIRGVDPTPAPVAPVLSATPALPAKIETPVAPVLLAEATEQAIAAAPSIAFAGKVELAKY